MRNQKRRDPEPVITRLEILVESIRDGKIKLPNFQRPFVWQKNDILNLLDSIYRGYPIGSILLWMTSEKLSSERSILEAIDFKEDEVSVQSEYLLDGQQRLTSVCGVLFWDGIKKTNKWNVYFDLENEEFIYSDNNDLVNLFPLNKLLETRTFLKECMKFEHHKNADKYYERAENLLKAVKDYKIAVVKIGDMKLEEVAPVFERINSRGRVLTMLDLMRAATWKGGFDLTKNIDETSEKIKQLGYGDLSSDTILKSIAVSAGKGFNKADIDKLRNLSSEELFSASDKSREVLILAFNFLKETVNITDESFVPYFQQLILLGEFFRVTNGTVSKKQTKILTSWFWVTSIIRHFSGASTGQNNRDLQKIRDFAKDENSDIHPVKSINLFDLLSDEFNLRVASSSTMAALLNSKGIQKDLQGHVIDQYELRKSKDFFKSLTELGEKKKLNVTRVLCRGKKSFSDENILSIPDSSFEENFLNSDCIRYLKDKNIDKFIEIRSKLFLEYISRIVLVDVMLSE